MKQAMRKSFRYLSMAALAVVGTMMSGCTGDVLTTVALQSETSKQSVTLTTTISLDGSSQTRALTDAGVKTFAVNDKIVVFYKNTNDETMMAESSLIQATDISAGGKKATITVTLDAPKASGTLRMIYPNTMARETIASDATIDDNSTIDFSRLDNQEGTLDMLASMLDLAVFDGTLTADAKLPDAVPMANRLAIGKFTIKDNGSDDITSSVKQLTINDGTNTYVVERTPEAGPIYVAMLPVDSKDFLLNAVTTSDAYKKSVTGQTLAANNIYPINLTMDFDAIATPLTLEVTVDNTEIRFSNLSHSSVPFTYTVNGVATLFDGSTQEIDIESLKAGDIVQFFSINSKLNDGSNTGLNIKSDQLCYVYGNVMSLIDDGEDGFANDKTIGGESAFWGLFSDSNIAFHPSKRLVLPATTLALCCYKEMFSNCDGITSLPEDFLPAKTLANNCYEKMFGDCDGLTSLPEGLLPAGKDGEGLLADWCYGGMFEDCDGLTSLPEKLLPAMTLKELCYWDMFAKCDGLTSLPEKFLPATTLAKECYMYMFLRCEKLTESPVLPDATLAERCYSNMFSNCPKLSNVTSLATSASLGSAANPFYYWLNNSGTADGCERIVYVDPSMLNPATDIFDLATSGEDGKRWTLATNDYAHLTSANIGNMLAADGNIYANTAAATATGTTAVAVIAYVGNVSNYFDKFLAIALTDVDGNRYTWADAFTKVGEYAAAHPITISGTPYNTNAIGNNCYDQVDDDVNTSSAKRTTGVVKGWRLPSVTDWRYVFEGFGGPAVNSQAGVTWRVSYGDGTALCNAINNACGNTDPKLQFNPHWSSSETSGNSDGAWVYGFSRSFFMQNYKTANFYVRAVFAY